ncbi:MarR family transcriptional regulator [Paenibacillus sp. LMG 31459]|jgi:DNA-binding MarR family transcriptional regulator|uniref:MarR family transcriptional regulator n=1 Tax=Paenibacillus phytohabitans TaxID=2654978 RepID=A0ABX1YIQ3_9BACL|nr:MarR family transcriptional regulator [Paenibacillus phytohabitans]NOU80384.1 MarR family transcriptional regulator [Paenibacillus phytohabitans]
MDMDNTRIIRSFGILNRTFLSYISKTLMHKDLSYSDSIFLVNIGGREGTSQEEIAHSLAIDKAAVARSVKNMESKGYITAVQSRADKRAKELYLTASGKELYQFMQQINDQWVSQVMQDLDADEVERFNQTMAKISERAKNVHKH